MRALVLCSLLAVSLLACKSREEKLQESEEKGALLAATQAKLLKGVGEALKTDGKEAAEVLSEGAGDVVKGLGRGFDKSLGEVKLSISEGVSAKGLGATRAARRAGQARSHAVSIYLTVDQPYTGPLELRAFDEAKREIGRARLDLDEGAPTAKYVDFQFDERTPLLTASHFELR